jgi:hypothetical protein
MVVFDATSAYVKLMRRFGDRDGDVSNVSVALLGLADQKRLAMRDAYELNLT